MDWDCGFDDTLQGSASGATIDVRNFLYRKHHRQQNLASNTLIFWIDDSRIEAVNGQKLYYQKKKKKKKTGVFGHNQGISAPTITQ